MVTGDESRKATFECPQCGHVQSIEDFINLNLDATRAYKDCLGRYVTNFGCEFTVDSEAGLTDSVRIVVDRNGNEFKVFNFI
ncbi:hypothetical protein SAMN06265361_10155 [Laceyella tengchongensis]|uniref:Uncharacterized protein n=1 Tax=Laceyella tengchongensis TaxID=574699 RepID=A0AA45WI92_9BACL|nr:hypothetical protein SAMN06265361_10155 [Laceyella tengchongensis]